jgi:hypothetical protein
MYGHSLLVTEHAEALKPTPEQIAERAAEQARLAHDKAIGDMLMAYYEDRLSCED